MSGTCFVIWDRDGSPPTDYSIRWRAYGPSDAASVPRLVELDEQRLRQRILAVLHDVASSPVGDTTLVEALEIRPDLSYWWMSLPAAKRWGGTGVVSDAVKLLALIDYLRAEDIVDVSFESDRLRSAALIGFALSACGFRVHSSTTPARRRRALLEHANALRLLLTRLTPRSGFKASQPDVEGLTLVGPHFRLVENDGHLQTAYFGGLPQLARTLGHKVTWVHLYTNHASAKSIRSVRKLLRREPGTHFLVDSVPIGRCLAVLLEYRRFHKRLKRFDSSIHLTGEAATVWPLFWDEWGKSLAGSHLMAAVIYLQGFEEILESIPHQRSGVYVMENQSWEFALQSAWRSKGNGTLIGMNHSSYRYWDLRYRVDPRDTARLSCRWPTPDRVASNGTLQDLALADNPVLSHLVDEVEALFYLELPSVSRGPRNRTIVLGELNRRSTARLVTGVLDALGEGGEIPILKAHPLNPVPARWTLDVETTERPLSELLPHARRVVMAASGTAMLEAVSVGVPVIAFLDGEELDLRPCRDETLVRAVRDQDELRAALQLADDAVITMDCFRLDPELGGWRSLLGFPPVSNRYDSSGAGP